jgi:hypothetical protein
MLVYESRWYHHHGICMSEVFVSIYHRDCLSAVSTVLEVFDWS